MAKWKAAPYRFDITPSSWIKIKNPEYSQARDGLSSSSGRPLQLAAWIEYSTLRAATSRPASGVENVNACESL